MLKNVRGRESLVFATALMLGAAACATSAFAQDTDGPTTSGFGELVVTAQKREQRLQDVPVSISVVSGQQISEMHIDDFGSLQGYVANFTMLSSGVNPVPYMRGFGSNPLVIAFDNDVSIYLDGIYGGRGAQFHAPFFDLERIEVLRGPQGALFGKNTAAGAISLVSAGPTSDFDAALRGAYNWERNGYELGGHVSGPISETLSGRFAANIVDQEGFIRNVATGNDDPQTEQQQARLSLRWQPNDSFDATAKLEYANMENTGGVTMAGSLTSPPVYRDYRFARDPYGPAGYAEGNGIQAWNGVLTANQHLGGDHTLTVVAGYSKYETTRLSAYDEVLPDGSLPTNAGNAAYANGFPEDFDQTSVEVRLASPTGGAFEYLVGVYYDTSDFHLHQDTFYQGVIGGTLTGYQSTDFFQESNTISLFGQASYRFTDALRAIGSLRWSQTEKDGSFSAQTVRGQALNAITSATGSISEDYTDPSLTLQYYFTPDVMGYATAARGSKSGGFVSNSYGTVNSTFTYRPETSTNYEIGLKSTLLDGRMVANIAIFDMSFEDLQQSAYDSDLRRFLTSNAAEASSTGVEIDVQWQPIEQIYFQLGLAYTDAKFDDFPGAQCKASETLAQCNSADPASIRNHNLAGTPLLFAPEWTGNFTTRVQEDIADNLRLMGTITALFRSEYFIADNYSPIYGLQSDWVKLDARIQLGATDDGWHLALVGRNLTDERTGGNAIRFPPSISATARSITWMEEYRSAFIEAAFKFN